ncbi:MAG: GNAT family N-acetyltransferase [Sporolactobacillus sp.]
MLVETERLIIRKLDSDDEALLYDYSREKTLRDELPDQVYDNLNEAHEVVEYLCANYNTTPQRYPLVYGIELKHTKTLVGHVGLSEIKAGIKIGYAVGMNYQGNGYATEAVGAFVKWAKENLGLNALYGIVKESNTGSQQVLLRNHFILQNEMYAESFGGLYRNKIYIL